MRKILLAAVALAIGSLLGNTSAHAAHPGLCRNPYFLVAVAAFLNMTAKDGGVVTGFQNSQDYDVSTPYKVTCRGSITVVHGQKSTTTQGYYGLYYDVGGTRHVWQQSTPRTIFAGCCLAKR